MTRNECYGILEIPRGATREEAVQAYRHLVQVWHPDRFGNNPDLQVKANAKLCQINDAYAILMSEEQQGAGAERNEAADTSSFVPYRDDQVQYLGSDPRLPATRSRISCVIELNPSHFQILLAEATRETGFMQYQWDSLIAIELGESHLIRAGSNPHQTPFRLDFGGSLPAYEDPSICQLFFADPEEILKTLILVKLKCRNEYFSRLLLKRIPLNDRFTDFKSTAGNKEYQPNIADGHSGGIVFVSFSTILLVLVFICFVASN